MISFCRDTINYRHWRTEVSVFVAPWYCSSRASVMWVYIAVVIWHAPVPSASGSSSTTAASTTPTASTPRSSRITNWYGVSRVVKTYCRWKKNSKTSRVFQANGALISKARPSMQCLLTLVHSHDSNKILGRFIQHLTRCTWRHCLHLPRHWELER